MRCGPLGEGFLAYSKPDFGKGLRVRDWLAEQDYSFEEQRQFGLDILGKIMRGDSLREP